jgi:hypothetical protein
MYNTNNQHKVISCGPQKITIYHLDSNKHRFESYDQPLKSHLDKLQLFGSAYKGKVYQEYEQEFTSVQMRQYHDAMFGLKSYSSQQLRSMSQKEKAEIMQMHTAANKVLGKWKQQLASRMVDDMLTKLIPKAKSAKEMIALTKGRTDNTMRVNMTFRDLKVTKAQIAQKLVDKNILPQDFFELKKAA